MSVCQCASLSAPSSVKISRNFSIFSVSDFGSKNYRWNHGSLNRIVKIGRPLGQNLPMAPWSFLGKLIGIIGSGRFFEEMYHWIHPASVFGAGGPSFNSEKSMIPEITCQMGSQEVNQGRKRSKMLPSIPRVKWKWVTTGRDEVQLGSLEVKYGQGPN